MKIIRQQKNFLFALILSFLTYLFFFGPFLTPNYFFWSADQATDVRIRHLPARTYLYDKIVKEHSFPFWTEKMYSGFPIYADMENAYLNPANVASILLFGPKLSYKVLHLLEYLVGSLSLYFLLKRKGIGLLGFTVANVIFYFNTFFINHQIHFGMIMALYLFPTALLMADLFLEKRQLRYIVFTSLVIANAVLWGHIQSVAMLLLGLTAFMVVFTYKKIRPSIFLFFFLALFALIVIETLPQMLPTYELLKTSSRDGGTDYLKGSLSPKMAIFAFVPYLLGESNNFFGRDISPDFRYNEIYFYSGISAFILAFLALLVLKKSRMVILAFVFIWIFLLFGFMESNQLFPAGTPLITYLREWERTAILLVFGIAILAGIFVEKIEKIALRNLKSGILFVIWPLIYLGVLIEMDRGKTAKKLDIYASYHYIQTYPFFPMLRAITLSLAGIFLVLFVVKKIAPHIFSKILWPIKILIIAIVFFDLLYFSRDVLSFRLQNVINYPVGVVPQELAGKRAILGQLDIRGMESLYYANWSPYGTGQLKEGDYVDYYGRLGIDLRGATSSNTEIPLDLHNLKDAGITAVTQLDGKTVFLAENKLDLLKNNLAGQYVEKKEGRIIMQIENPTAGNISTYLKYSPYWRVEVDGEKTTTTKASIFLDFFLPQGEHLVKLTYYPEPFFRGIFLSLILLGIIISGYYLFRKTLRKSLCKN